MIRSRASGFSLDDPAFEPGLEALYLFSVIPSNCKKRPPKRPRGCVRTILTNDPSTMICTVSSAPDGDYLGKFLQRLRCNLILRPLAQALAEAFETGSARDLVRKPRSQRTSFLGLEAEVRPAYCLPRKPGAQLAEAVGVSLRKWSDVTSSYRSLAVSKRRASSEWRPALNCYL